jgi:uncharacterized protein YeeX (DUF496 family)
MEPDKTTQLFFYLVSTFELSALQQMGKLKDPRLGELERNLEQAQFTIDLLDMLKEKTKGNLNTEETRYVENVIAQLKLNYVDEVDKDKKQNIAGTEEKKPEENEPEDENKA